MFFKNSVLFLKVHSQRGLHFQLGSEKAIELIRKKYGSLWFGALQDFLHLSPPSMEFLPFYYCQGTVTGKFYGTVTYSNMTSSSNSRSIDSSRRIKTEPQLLKSSFASNNTQIYAGYRYNIRHVHKALRNEENSLHLCKLQAVDTTLATINNYEYSVEELDLVLHDEVKRQAEDTARSMVKSYHPTAFSININFIELNIQLEEVTPVLVPCYVVKARYDMEEYTLYVNGIDGTVSGPLLFNAQLVARVFALSSIVLALLLLPNTTKGLLGGFLLAVPVYYAAFYAAKLAPPHLRDYFRSRQRQLRLQHKNDSGKCALDVPSQQTKE